MNQEIDQVADDRLAVAADSVEIAQAMANGLRGLPDCVEAVAGIRSVELLFDLARVDAGAFRGRVEAALASLSITTGGEGRVHDIPVRYGGDDGPDFDSVCTELGLSRDEFIRRHTESTLTVAMLGFTPGFAYIDGMDAGLAVPRRESPRAAVAAGSVGIAAGRTGIYALPGPGGWQIIGRTDTALFNPASSTPFLLAPGDRVKLVVAES